jgi:hypothetical protein
MLHRAESTQRYVAVSHDSALCNIAGSHDAAVCSIAHIREYFGEFKTEFENILGHYSGAKGQLIYEKTRCRKSCETVSLKELSNKNNSCMRCQSAIKNSNFFANTKQNSKRL